ncbi:MAG: hypothetical protein ONB44_04145 [candidate division KSB1 bacterium]|nr:hypothetical protein [candidate division KSB1 bacterium]MDZ7301322.1 hypothetical protein [candidate division KSB1 bacterium]MDZ7310793.1 hypothetical protein [candidate division KSB1 bacterium]
MNSHTSKKSAGDRGTKAPKWRLFFPPGASRSNAQLIIVLVILLAIMLFLRRLGTSDLPIPTASPVLVDNLTYQNQLYNFAIRAPSTDWEIVSFQNPDTLRQENPAASVLENINPFLEMRRRDREAVIALVQVGVIELVASRTSNRLALQNLDEIRRDFTLRTDTVRIIQPVTPVSGARVQGAYFAVEVPKTAQGSPRTIWINSFWVHNQLGYSIMCQTTRNDYAYVVKDLEAILGSFRYLQ